MWACLIKGFNTLVTAGVLNLPDKQVDPYCWLRSGFESPWRQLDFKPLSGSYQLRTLHCRVTLICASLGGGGGLIINYHFHFPFPLSLSFYHFFFMVIPWILFDYWQWWSIDLVSHFDTFMFDVCFCDLELISLG